MSPANVAMKTFGPEPTPLRAAVTALADVVLALFAPLGGLVCVFLFAHDAPELGLSPGFALFTRIGWCLIAALLFAVLGVRVVRRLSKNEVRLFPDRIEHRKLWTRTVPVSEIDEVTLVCSDLRTPTSATISGRDGARILVSGATWPFERLALTLGSRSLP